MNLKRWRELNVKTSSESSRWNKGGSIHKKSWMIWEQTSKLPFYCWNMRWRTTINCQLFQAEKVDLQELSTQLQEMTLCSLGPNDCIYVMNGRVVTTGWLAAQLKHQVEVTKMGEMRQETLLDEVPKKCFCEKRRLGPLVTIQYSISIPSQP